MKKKTFRESRSYERCM